MAVQWLRGRKRRSIRNDKEGSKYCNVYPHTRGTFFLYCFSLCGRIIYKLKYGNRISYFFYKLYEKDRIFLTVRDAVLLTAWLAESMVDCSSFNWRKKCIINLCKKKEKINCNTHKVTIATKTQGCFRLSVSAV